MFHRIKNNRSFTAAILIAVLTMMIGMMSDEIAFGYDINESLNVNGNIYCNGYLISNNMVLNQRIDKPQIIDFYYGPSTAGIKTLRFFGNTAGTTLNIELLDGSLKVAGITTAQSYACSSDLRWKKNINTIDNALQKVLGLRGVNYFWRVDEFKDKGFTREKQIGFVAQEVEKLVPELVHTDKDGYKTMSYDRVTALLVEAVKELKKQSDAKIAVLEKENAQLKNRLASLEKLEQRMAALEKAQASKGNIYGMK